MHENMNNTIFVVFSKSRGIFLVKNEELIVER
jgi:hypothetical protein